MAKNRSRVTIHGDASAAMVVYKITNTVTGRSYIGITSRTLARRVREHVYEAMLCGSMYALHVSMRNRGPEVFSAEVLEQHADMDALNAAEIRLIRQHGTYANGYNRTEGGGGLTGFVHGPTRRRAPRRLNEDDIRAILLDSRPAKEIAAEYGFASKSTVTLIARGQRYKDLYDKACETLPAEVIERNLKFRSNPRPHKTGDLHHMRRDPDLARRHSEKLKGRAAPHTAARNIANRTLTEEDIRLILTDPRPARAIAEMFAKSTALIRNIRSGTKYADVVQKIQAEMS